MRPAFVGVDIFVVSDGDIADEVLTARLVLGHTFVNAAERRSNTCHDLLGLGQRCPLREQDTGFENISVQFRERREFQEATGDNGDCQQQQTDRASEREVSPLDGQCRERRDDPVPNPTDGVIDL